MTNYPLPIIILVDERDDITHTPEWPQCKDASCPCQDEIILTMPTEEQLDAQEQSVLSQDEPPYDAPHCPQCGWLYAFGNRSHLCDECAEQELDAQERESDALWVNGDEEDEEADEEPTTSGPRRIDWGKIFE
jgi:hypothetical protein